MPWWLLPILVFSVWVLGAIAIAAESIAENLRRGIPRNEWSGVSAAPVIPMFPLAFWGAAALIDFIAAPWGTWIVGSLHGALGMMLAGSILRLWRCRNDDASASLTTDSIEPANEDSDMSTQPSSDAKAPAPWTSHALEFGVGAVLISTFLLLFIPIGLAVGGIMHGKSAETLLTFDEVGFAMFVKVVDWLIVGCFSFAGLAMAMAVWGLVRAFTRRLPAGMAITGTVFASMALSACVVGREAVLAIRDDHRLLMNAADEFRKAGILLPYQRDQVKRLLDNNRPR